LGEHNPRSTAVRDLFSRRTARASHGQRGWIGLIGLLLALVIVAVLAQKVLKTYGFLAGAEPGTHSSGERGPRGPGGAPAPLDPSVRATPTAAIERARGLEKAVQQQADDLNKRIDDTSK
jgi:hypothetical protein